MMADKTKTVRNHSVQKDDAIKAQGVELFDTTLRDGEQTPGASFSKEGRASLFMALDRIGMDYVEVGWPIVSEDIRDAFRLCRREQNRASIVAFGSTSIRRDPKDDENLRMIIQVSPDVACIFGKSWVQHVSNQLGISKDENIEKISGSVDLLRRSVKRVFYDAEHYFDGFMDDQEYALSTIKAAADAGAERIILCDTNGGTIPEVAASIVKKTSEWLKSEHISTTLGTHFHDDSGLALANAFATMPWVRQVQGTINGTGERIGNLNIGAFAAGYILKMNGHLPRFRLDLLKQTVEHAYRTAGLQMPNNQLYVGRNAFTHRGGVHIDAIGKAASYEHVPPKMVGNSRSLSLNSLGGRIGVLVAAEKFGYALDKKDPSVISASRGMLEELKRMEMKGYRMGEIEAEQYLLVDKYFGKAKRFFELNEPRFSISRNHSDTSLFSATFNVGGNVSKESIELTGGPVEAAYKLFKSVLSNHYDAVDALHLDNFGVEIANRREESSTVRTEIEFRHEKGSFRTVGVDSDILMSALEAIEKGFRYYLKTQGTVS
jgi:2-isopropylmalate synthase